MKQMKIDINIPVTIFKEGKYFIAHSSVLDLSTSAETFEKVQVRFRQAVEIFFEETIRKNTLDEVLLGLGWRKINKNWSPPPLISCHPEKVRVNLPKCRI